MKRCIKWLINWFCQWIGKMSWQEKVGFSLGGLLGIVVGIITFVYLNVYTFWLWAFLAAIYIGSVMYSASAILLTILIFIPCILWEKISKNMK